MLKKIIEAFKHHYTEEPSVYQSPGRINLIGEHTDYNQGFVLPAAINFGVIIAISKRSDDGILVYSLDFDEYLQYDLADIQPVDRWSTYILGVVSQFQKKGYQLSGFNVVVGGDVPIGAGLSSSAAIECAMAFALNDLFNLDLDRLALVQMAQKAEHEFAGVQCGIMDQMASMYGVKGNVLKLDCRSCELEYFPLSFDDIKIVLFDTQVKHKLVSSEYNIRRAQCEEGVRMIRTRFAEVNSLREATLEMLQQSVPEDSVIYQRCKYVIEEIDRVTAGCQDLLKRDIHSFGKKMFATHEGLSKLYEVSCPELDFLVDEGKKYESVIGSRMMGGGFGGCTINLIDHDQVDQVVQKISSAYLHKWGKPLQHYVVALADGTSKWDTHGI